MEPGCRMLKSIPGCLNCYAEKMDWQCQNGELINKYPGIVIIPEYYWIIVVHSQNLGNNMESSPGMDIYTDAPVNLKELARKFSLEQ